MSDGILGERAVTGAVDLVARLELGHLLTDGLDDAAQTPAWVGRLGPADAEPHDAHELGQTGHQMPGTPIHAGSTYFYQDLVVADGRPVDLCQSEDLFGHGTVFVLDDRLHRFGVGGTWRRLDRVIEHWGLRRFVLRGHRAAPIELSWDSESFTVMRRPRITSQSANTNSTMPVIAETSDEEPRTSTRTAVSKT